MYALNYICAHISLIGKYMQVCVCVVCVCVCVYVCVCVCASVAQLLAKLCDVPRDRAEYKPVKVPSSGL